MIGQTISHYKILEKLGEGGMGVVYKAEDTKLKRTVALKFLPKELTRDEVSRERFRREAQAAAALNHPNIVTIYEIDEHDEQTYIAMECVEGQTLKEIISGAGTHKTVHKDVGANGGSPADGEKIIIETDRQMYQPLQIDQIIYITTQICAGLAKAHKAGIIHRDIKPQNIIIDKDGRVKILDFGLAKLKGVSPLTKDSTTLGTVYYMSPEQAQGTDLDHRTDIWSLGVVLYEMITGQLPFNGDYPQAVIYSILHEEPEPVKAQFGEIPGELEQLVNKTLAKEPSARYQHADDLLVDLRKIKEKSKPGIKTTGKEIARSTVLSMFQTRRFILPLSILLAVLVVTGSYFIFKGKKEEKLLSHSTAEAVKPGVPKWQNSVAVLPFRDFSPGKDQEYFCDGLTDSIIGRLSKVKKLKIISLTSVLQYKNQARDVKKIGRDLEVNTILEGTFQKEEDKIRISAKLINVADDSHIWQNTYNRQLASVFAIQDDISQSIVKALKIELLGEKTGKNTDVRDSYYTRFTDAYDLYVQGRFFWRKRTEESLKKAVQFFNKALKKDPAYAPAYAGLADTYTSIASTPSLSKKEGYTRAEQAALKALKIDNRLAEAHASLALVKLDFQWDFAGAKKSFQRAIELNPGYAAAHHWYGRYFWYTGSIDNALTEMKQALALDPLSPSINRNLGWTYFYARRYDKAMEVMRRTIEVYPDFPLVHLALALVYLEKSMYEDALNEIKKGYDHSSPEIEYWTTIIRARMGNLKGLKEYIHKIEKTGAINKWMPVMGAILYAELGSADRFFAWFERVIDQRDKLIVVLKNLPGVDKFRTDPRYRTLLNKIGLEK